MDDAHDLPLGVVLAGGMSSRMGRDKAALEIDGSSLLQAALRVLAPCCGRIAVSGRVVPGFDSIADLQPGLGPVGGIVSAVDWALHLAQTDPAPSIVFVPLDMPGLRTADLARLLDALGGADAAHFSAHPLPLALRLDPALRQRIAAPIAPGAAPSVRGWLEGLRVARIDSADADLDNVNTPDDWLRRARRGA